MRSTAVISLISGSTGCKTIRIGLLKSFLLCNNNSAISSFPNLSAGIFSAIKSRSLENGIVASRTSVFPLSTSVISNLFFISLTYTVDFGRIRVTRILNKDFGCINSQSSKPLHHRNRKRNQFSFCHYTCQTKLKSTSLILMPPDSGNY